MQLIPSTHQNGFSFFSTSDFKMAVIKSPPPLNLRVINPCMSLHYARLPRSSIAGALRSALSNTPNQHFMLDTFRQAFPNKSQKTNLSISLKFTKAKRAIYCIGVKVPFSRS